MRFHFPFNWYNRFGTIPSEFREAMSYEEQILWLCQANVDLKEQFEAFQVSIDDLEIRVENLEGAIVNKQDTLIPGENIYMFGNEILAELNLDLTEDLVAGEYIDLSGEIGSVVDTTPIEAENTAWVMLNVKANEYYLFRGTYTLAKTNYDLEMTLKYEQTTPSDSFSYFQALSDGKLIVSWNNTDINQPYFAMCCSPSYIINMFNSIPDWVYEGGTSLVTSISASSTDNEVPTAKAVYTALGGGGSTSYEDLTNKPSINGVTLEGNLSTADLDIETGIPVLQNDTFNVWNLDNGIYNITANQNTELYCGDVAMPLGLGNDSHLLFVFGTNYSQLAPKWCMLLRGGSDGRPNFDVAYCESENSGVRIDMNANAVSYNVNQVNVMGDSNIHVPTEHSVKGYVDSVVGTIATTLQTINTGTGV